MSAKIQFSTILKGQHEASLPNCIGDKLKCERELENAYDKSWGGTPIWNRRGCSWEILNLTPKGDHLGVAQAFSDP